jgi:hypothetical protein
VIWAIKPRHFAEHNAKKRKDMEGRKLETEDEGSPTPI